MKRHGGFYLLLIATALLTPIYTQTVKDEDFIRIDTQLIDVPVIVTDKAGRPLLNLKQNDFVIFEDGKKQEIADFSTTSAPFELTLLLDTSGSTRSDLQKIQRATDAFISSLRAGDRVSIIAYRADKVNGVERAVSEVLVSLTDNKSKLRDALTQVTTSNGTPYYDSLIQVIDKVFNKQPEEKFRGRRALVALTDGVDSNSAAEFITVKTHLQKAAVISYFIQVDTQNFFEDKILGDCRGSLWFSQSQIRRYYDKFYPQANFEKVYDFCEIGEFERLDISRKLYKLAGEEMAELARMSGGRVFPIANLQGAKDAFDEVAKEIGTKYSISYYSDNDKKDGAFRKIRVELKGFPAGTVVRAREGYTAPTK